MDWSHAVNITLELNIGGQIIVRKKELLYEIKSEDMARSFMDRTVEELTGIMFTIYYFYDLGGNCLHQVRFPNAVNFEAGFEIKVGGKHFIYVDERKFKEKSNG